MAAKEKINLLEVIPSRNAHIITDREGDYIVIAYSRFKHKWMQRFLLPKGMSPMIRVRFEEHGTAVWKLINGKDTVRQIIEKLAEHFHHEVNYESRIITYIFQLQKDGFITFLLPGQL